MKVELYNFVSALNCVLAQRLVRRICVHCKEKVDYPKAVIDESGLDPALLRGSMAQLLWIRMKSCKRENAWRTKA